MKRSMTWKILMIPLLLTYVLFLNSIVSGEYPVEKPSLSSGREIFNSNCAGCHGGKGDGTVLKGAFNFSDNEQMVTKNSSLFFNAVTNGVPGTAMPSFGKLSTPQRRDVVAYLWTFWADNDGVEHGKNIYQRDCASCHGTKGEGGIMDTPDFTNVNMMETREPKVFFRSIGNGIQGNGMPSWKDSLSEDERWNAVKYIWTFQFKEYSLVDQPPVETPFSEIPPSEIWYYTPVGMGIVAISIILAGAVLYLFGKGMQER